MQEIRYADENVMLNQKPVDMKRHSILFFVMALFLVSCEEEAKEAFEDKQET